MKAFLSAAVLAMGVAGAANADVNWTWQFAGESGTFTTDGVPGAGTFTVLDFSVTSSSAGGDIGSVGGGEYTQSGFSTNPPYQIVYDGTNVTAWLHAGSNTFDWNVYAQTSDPDRFYFFGWDSGNINDPSKAAYYDAGIGGELSVGDCVVRQVDDNCIDFEGTPGGAVPAGYEGMNWSAEFYSLDGTNYGTDSGYKVLGTWVGFNAFAANEISFASQDGSEFNLTTIDAAAAWRDWVEIRFDGLRNGSLIHTSTRRITADSRNVITLNFANIDEVVFTYLSDSGTNYWTGGDGTHVAYDNICIEDAAANMSLRVTGECPGTVRVEWDGAAPNATVALVFAKNTGNFVIPFGPCQGTVLGLGNQGIRLVNTFPSGPNGSGSRNGPAGRAACRGYLQMHDIPNCTTSNVAQLP